MREKILEILNALPPNPDGLDFVFAAEDIEDLVIETYGPPF